MKTVIVDYNAGNVKSLQFALERLGVDAQITYDNEMISKQYYDNVMKNKVKYNNVISKNENNDYNYNFFGFKTLERAYLLKIEGKIIERPQHMWMRVSLGIHGEDIKLSLIHI